MMWREEQRAVGEMMIGDSRQHSTLRLLGFASFADQYQDRFARWFATFEADLRAPDAEKAQRLRKLEALFGELTKVLGDGPDRVPALTITS